MTDTADWPARTCSRLLPSFVAGDALGRGAFGVVIEGQHGKASLALKVIDKTTPALSDARIMHRVRTEARILRKLDGHANVVRCFGAVEDEQALIVVLEAAGESLDKIVTAEGAMDAERAAPIVLQLVRALRHMHTRKIAHRDVKLDNVMLDAALGRAVLGDFGTALAVRTQGSRLDVRCGSHEYNAPEMLDAASKGYYGPAVDMWATGVLVYTLLSAKFPFGRAQTKICRGACEPLRGVCAPARDFIAAALVVDPNSVQKVNRLSSVEACRHAWLKPHEAVVSAISAPVLPSEELCEAVRLAQEALAGGGGGAGGGGTADAVVGVGDEEEAPSGSTPRGAPPGNNDDDEVEGGAFTQGADATARLLQLSLEEDDEV